MLLFFVLKGNFCLFMLFSFCILVLVLIFKSMGMKKVLLLLFALGTLTVSCSDELEVVNDGVALESRAVSSDFVDVSFPMEANLVYSRLLDSFRENVSRSLDDRVLLYPDYYGGAYIDDGKLVVNVCNGHELAVDKLKNMAQSDDVVIRPCKYSYNYLLDVMSKIRKFCADNRSNPLALNIDSYSLEDKENIVLVNLLNCTDADIKSFKENVCDDSSISFIKVDGPSALLSSVNPGEGFYYEKNNDGNIHMSSVGYRCKVGNVAGFVTAGHSLEYSGIKVYKDFNGTSSYFGESTISFQEGPVDAAFVKLYSGFDVTGIVGEGELYPVAMTPAVGTTINLRSFKGHAYGPITSVNREVNYRENGVIVQTFTGLIEVNFDRMTVKGESGGVVYAIDSSTKKRFIVGLLNGGSTVEAKSYISKALEINKKLGITLY